MCSRPATSGVSGTLVSQSGPGSDSTERKVTEKPRETAATDVDVTLVVHTSSLRVEPILESGFGGNINSL